MRSAITLLKPLARPVRTRTRLGGPPRPADGRDTAPAGSRRSPVVDCAAYIDGRRVETADIGAAVRLVRSAGAREGKGFVWVGLREPDSAELENIAALFGLHPLAVEDAVHAHQRPKLERYDDGLFAVVKTARYVQHDRLTATSQVVDTGEVMAFLGDDFVVTVRHGDHGALKPVRHQLEESPELLALGPAAVLYAIIDRVVDDYLAVTHNLQLDIDEVESSVFSPQRSNDVERIYQLKREVIELKRAVAPLAQPLRLLATRHFRSVHPQIREYFRDAEDHLARVVEQVASFDELLSSILQAQLTQVTLADNEDMRKISAWGAILAVPTAVCGIYGMNFTHMPELHLRYGYPLVMLSIVAVCALLYRGFRRNGWL